MKQMKRYSLLSLLLVILILPARGVERERMKEFILKKPQVVISNSLYDKLEVIDQRKEKELIGRVDYAVISKPPLASQLKEFVKNVTDVSAQSGTLVLCLKKFKFSQQSAVLNTQRFCSMNADLYEKQDSLYYLIETIDTMIGADGSITSGKRILQKGDSLLTTLLTRNLLKHGTSNVGVSFSGMVSSDSIAKRKIKLYNTAEFVNGVYYHYESFKNQNPDVLATISVKKDKIRSVSLTDSAGVVKKLFPIDVYAIVVEGRPFISTGSGFYPLQMEEDEFIFTGDFSVPYSGGVAVLFGVVGAIALSNSKTLGEFDAMINYKNGDLIRLRRLDTLMEENNR